MIVLFISSHWQLNHETTEHCWSQPPLDDAVQDLLAELTPAAVVAVVAADAAVAVVSK